MANSDFGIGPIIHYSDADGLAQGDEAQLPTEVTTRPHLKESVVVLQAEVRDQVRAHDVAQRVFELHRLDKEIVLRVQAFRRLRRLEVEAQPLLNSDRAELGRAL